MGVYSLLSVRERSERPSRQGSLREEGSRTHGVLPVIDGHGSARPKPTQLCPWVRGKGGSYLALPGGRPGGATAARRPAETFLGLGIRGGGALSGFGSGFGGFGGTTFIADCHPCWGAAARIVAVDAEDFVGGAAAGILNP